MHKTKENPGIKDKLMHILGFFKSRLLEEEKLKNHKIVSPGTTVEDYEGKKYLLLEPLGDGLKGIVYKSFDLETNNYTAIKFLLEAYKEDFMSRRMFSVEFDLLKKLSNIPIAGVVKVFSNGVVDINDEIPFFVMEYLNGLSLSHKLKNERKISFRQAMKIGLGVVTILENIHNLGIIHRDIKPTHIYLTQSEELVGSEDSLIVNSVDVKEELSMQTEWKNIARGKNSRLIQQSIVLIDFGFAIDTKYGSDNLILGTPEYMAPEVFRGESTSPSVDIYALGIVLYRSIFGTVPFESSYQLSLLERFKELAQMHQNMQPTKKELECEVPEDVWYIINKCLAKNPSDRYLTATEMRIDIQNYLYKVVVT